MKIPILEIGVILLFTTVWQLGAAYMRKGDWR